MTAYNYESSFIKGFRTVGCDCSSMLQSIGQWYELLEFHGIVNWKAVTLKFSIQITIVSSELTFLHDDPEFITKLYR